MKSTTHYASGGEELNARIVIWKENDVGYETLPK